MAKPPQIQEGRCSGAALDAETHTDASSEAGISDEIRLPHRPAWPQLILYAALITVTLVLFNNHRPLPGHGPAIRIITALLLFVFGWGFASALGRTLTPAILGAWTPAPPVRSVLRSASARSSSWQSCH